MLTVMQQTQAQAQADGQALGGKPETLHHGTGATGSRYGRDAPDRARIVDAGGSRWVSARARFEEIWRLHAVGGGRGRRRDNGASGGGVTVRAVAAAAVDETR